jgi:hypothetical protein
MANNSNSGNSNSWKECNSQGPYYKFQREEPNEGEEFTKNWHGVPIAGRPSIVHLSPDFLASHVIPPRCERLALTFENNLTGPAAKKWISTFASIKSYILKIEKTFTSGFHILQILGEDRVRVQKTLLDGSPTLSSEVYACFSEYSEDLDFADPVGLPQLLYITFKTPEPWVEDALDDIFINVGKVVSFINRKQGLTYFYTVLVVHSKRFFMHEVTVPLPDRDVTFHLSFKGLALRCFTCGSPFHESRFCKTLKVLPIATAANSDPEAPPFPEPDQDIELPQAPKFCDLLFPSTAPGSEPSGAFGSSLSLPQDRLSPEKCSGPDLPSTVIHNTKNSVSSKDPTSEVVAEAPLGHHHLWWSLQRLFPIQLCIRYTRFTRSLRTAPSRARRNQPKSWPHLSRIPKLR